MIQTVPNLKYLRDRLNKGRLVAWSSLEEGDEKLRNYVA